MAKKQTKREKYPLEVVNPYAGMFVLQTPGYDGPSHMRVRRYFTSQDKAMAAMRSMYKRIPLRDKVARFLGIHPLDRVYRYADGGYPVLYFSTPYPGQEDILCWRCANKERGSITAVSTYEEGPPTYCEQCNRVIESAYGDPDQEEEETCTP